ncbi:hypothetical protein E1091_01295 [Micromonospora fluostatini]|uniref:Uncharacterized protein n=1 Tax=Micromonospora fluostatini TaxID=1629071 RepID=A0ABY2DLQ2_9ACTN|nr:hypothetical protein E1091_01295 [Micromonospora fluostatini]
MTPTTTARSWTLTIPAPGDWELYVGKTRSTWRAKPKWLTMNSRLHWRKKDKIKTLWRAATREAARAAVTHDGRTVSLPVGQVSRARVDAVVHFTTVLLRRDGTSRRDIENWREATKVIVDTLIAGTRTHPGWGFLPDDGTRLHCPDCPHVREAPEALDTKPPYGPVGLVVVTLTELLPGEAP